MRSMTGFGRSEAEKDGRKMTIEIKSVNHRFLDVNIRMPRTLGFAEEGIRKAVKSRLARGRVDIFVNYTSLGEDAKKAEADMGLIKSYLEAARYAAKQTGLEDDLALSHIIRVPDAIVVEEAQEDEELQTALVQQALAGALTALADMRAREGKALMGNINECLDGLEGVVDTVRGRTGYVAEEYSEKLKTRITELLSGTDIDETRFNTEIAYIADKADVTEEIVRLQTHITQFRKASGKGEAMGRKLDFIVQEMNRELNTIGSKSQDIPITDAVIEGKSLVEKIREQVQNIE